MIGHLPIYSLIEVERLANWSPCSKFLTVIENPLTVLNGFFALSLWPLSPLLLVSQLLLDDKCHQESSAEKCNQKQLTEKSHQESTKSTNGMLNFI